MQFYIKSNRKSIQEHPLKLGIVGWKCPCCLSNLLTVSLYSRTPASLRSIRGSKETTRIRTLISSSSKIYTWRQATSANHTGVRWYGRFPPLGSGRLIAAATVKESKKVSMRRYRGWHKSFVALMKKKLSRRSWMIRSARHGQDRTKHTESSRGADIWICKSNVCAQH